MVCRAWPLLARAAARAGLEVTKVAPGAALVQRRDARGRGRYRTVPLAARARVLTPRNLPRPKAYARDKATWEWLFGNHLRHVLSTYAVDTVLDVGANTGQFARQLRRLGFRGRILSFEPVPDVFAELERTAASDPLWSAHQLALGRADTTLSLNVIPDTFSSVLPPNDYGAHRFEQMRTVHRIEVPVRRLDGVLHELLGADPSTRRMYLKLDTQGFDVEAFTGAAGCLDAVVAMQSELSLLPIYDGMPRMPEALAAFEGAGFEISAMAPVSYDHEAVRVLEYDCILVRASALSR